MRLLLLGMVLMKKVVKIIGLLKIHGVQVMVMVVILKLKWGITFAALKMILCMLT